MHRCPHTGKVVGDRLLQVHSPTRSTSAGAGTKPASTGEAGTSASPPKSAKKWGIKSPPLWDLLAPQVVSTDGSVRRLFCCGSGASGGDETHGTDPHRRDPPLRNIGDRPHLRLRSLPSRLEGIFRGITADPPPACAPPEGPGPDRPGTPL